MKIDTRKSERAHVAYALHIKLKRIRIKPVYCNVRGSITIIMNCLLNAYMTGEFDIEGLAIESDAHDEIIKARNK